MWDGFNRGRDQVRIRMAETRAVTKKMKRRLPFCQSKSQTSFKVQAKTFSDAVAHRDLPHP